MVVLLPPIRGSLVAGGSINGLGTNRGESYEIIASDANVRRRSTTICAGGRHHAGLGGVGW